ncbi:hypothetical protein NC652_010353 [Populus alba x Populus x berolinensis]|nr:hypothetical protein NC652_010353 [Populus alba x Populus x berolinensis]
MEIDREGRWLRFWSKEMKATGDGEEKSLGWRERKTDRGKRGRVVCERRPWFGQETEAAGEEERELGAKQRREVEERSGKRKGDQRLGKRENESEGGGSKRTVRGSLVCGDEESNRETTTTCLSISDGEDGECFHKGDLAGTVGPYDRNVFLCFKNPDAWLPHVEEDDLPKVISTALKTCKDDITYSCMICVEKQEEKKQPGLREVLAVVAELLVVVGGAAGDPLQLLEKAENQRWMLIASVVFDWGRVEVTMCSNIIREVGAERCMIYVEKQEEKKLPSLREVLAVVAGLS